MLVAAAAALLVPLPPAAVERWYTNGVYAVLQPALTRVSNLVPFAWLDVALAAGCVLIVLAVVRARRKPLVSRWRRALGLLLGGLEGAAIVYLAFLVLWGLNYRRVPATERFAVDPDRHRIEHLRALVAQAVEQVNATHHPGDRDDRLAPAALLRSLPSAFHAAQARLESPWHAVPGRPKASLVARTFRLSSVDGMLNPFGLEVVLNPDVLPFERPFVLAHEWAHLAGHADESEASFLAWLACLEGDRPAQYSGWLAVLLHAVRGLPEADRQAGLGALGPGPREDIRALQDRFARSNPVVRRVSWELYDQYLRANRVESGVASYDEVVQLVLGARVAAPLLRPPPP